MKKNYRTKHIFLAIGICVAISTPFLLIFTPQTVANILYHPKGIAQVFVPKENYVVYGIGFLLLFLAAMLPYIFSVRKISIILGLICVGLSVVPFFSASQSYKLVSEESLAFRTILSKKEYTYAWDDVERIIYQEGEDEEFPEYKFIFEDGNQLSFEENAYFTHISSLLHYLLKENNLRIEKQ